MRKTAEIPRKSALALLIALLTMQCIAAEKERDAPDWRDQVIYFVMTDRFDDAQADNDDQRAGEYDPRDNAKYSGGDLAGVTRRLDYIRRLGATAVWITPPVANQWWNPATKYGGYHGYWAIDFKSVDAHEGTLRDYRQLARQLHAHGMLLVQDIVVNHTANFIDYGRDWDPNDPSSDFHRITDTQGHDAPTQAPFDQNDARDPGQRSAAIYHWTPDIQYFKLREQETTWQLSGLDDLNTENPAVRAALRDSYGYWIRNVGVDAFRVDTAFHVPPEFFADFLYSNDANAPGIYAVARQAGIRNFHLFGEGFGIDKPFDDKVARKIDGYMRDADGRPLLPGMLDYPLYSSLQDVFVHRHPPAELAWRIDDRLRVHANPWLMPSFVDNHDVDRFLQHADATALKQALLAILTLPGIPTIYYGTEQGFTEPREAMFAGGYGSGGADHFDERAPLFRYLQSAIALRRGNKAFSRGTPVALCADKQGPGALVYRMDYAGKSALVAINTSEQALDTNIASGLAADARLDGTFGIDGKPANIHVAADGSIALHLPAGGGQVWLQR